MELLLTAVVEGQRRSWPAVGDLLRIGRSSRCEVQLADATVSKEHAELVRDGLGWKVRDSAPVREGDTIQFGQVEVRFGREAQTAVDRTRFSESSGLGSAVRQGARDIINRAAAKGTEGARLVGLLAEAGQMLVLPRPIAETCQEVLRVVERAVPARRLVILLREAPGMPPVQIAVRHLGVPTREPLALSQTILAAVLDDCQSIVTRDAAEDPRFAAQESVMSQSIRSAMAVPLFDNEKVLGALYADTTDLRIEYGEEHLEVFTVLANMAAVKITNARLLETEQHRLRMQQELSTAMGIQRGLLPDTAPDVPGYTCLARLESCFEVGGDLYDWQPTHDGALWIVQGDVTGKGMGAALLMSSFIASSRVLLETDRAPEAIAAHLNKIMLRSTDPVHFVTAFIGRLEPDTGRLVYVNAGHPPPLLLDSRGVTALETTGPPIGMLPNLPFQVAEAQIEPGALLAIFSDGIPEARRSAEDLYFEDERVIAALTELKDRPTLDEIAAGLIEHVDRFLAGEPRSDDITVTLVRRDS